MWFLPLGWIFTIEVILTVPLSSRTWTEVSLRITLVFSFVLCPRGGLGVTVCACVCVQSCGGYMFGLVWLSVYVCAHWCGSVHKRGSPLPTPRHFLPPLAKEAWVAC